MTKNVKVGPIATLLSFRWDGKGGVFIQANGFSCFSWLSKGL